MSTYSILINILDKLCEEAPAGLIVYHPSKGDKTKIDQARSRAYIHLYLKATKGIIDFEDRELLITDGGHDGGIDAFFIDQSSQIIYFIQSKFSANESNFKNPSITPTDLLKMDIPRILAGETEHENHTPYNNKVIGMQRTIASTPSIGKYIYKVILLASLNKSITAEKLKILTSGLDAIIYDSKKAISDLVFPILTGTFYNYSDFDIRINVSDKSKGASLSYSADTALGNCKIEIYFVPLIEIGKLMYTYKNYILKYNPRNYLSLKEGSINDEIKQTIIEKTTNEFAIYNNGITILCDGSDFNANIGVKGVGELALINPQIINGGQTAFTLSLIYEESLEINKSYKKRLEEKEVLVKIVTLNIPDTIPLKKKLKFIQSISDANNKQNQVNIADRFSNSEALKDGQKKLFVEFGFLFERKRGEFFDSIRYGYINKEDLIDRSVFIKIAYACLQKYQPAAKERQLFTTEKINSILNTEADFRKYYFGCLCYTSISNLESNTEFGNGKNVGIYAVIAVCFHSYYKVNVSDEELKRLADDAVLNIITVWSLFEDYACIQFHNSDYFIYEYNYSTDSVKQVLHFDKYYKSAFFPIDVNAFFMLNDTFMTDQPAYPKKVKKIETLLEQKSLSPELIKKIAPLINRQNWFGDLETITGNLELSTFVVRQAIIMITSKPFGYYIRQFWNTDLSTPTVK